MNKLLIFLDIDGVIATKRALRDLWINYAGKSFEEIDDAGVLLKKLNLNWPSNSVDYFPFDREALDNIMIFQRSFENTKVEYIISSAWRTGRTVDEMKKLFRLKGLHLNEIIGKTKHFGARGLEILQWLEDNGMQDQPYLVFDDECSSDIHQYISDDLCVNTTWESGFDYDKLKEAIKKGKNALKNDDKL